MKRLAACTAIAILLAIGGSALAQGYDRHGDHGRHDQGQHRGHIDRDHDGRPDHPMGRHGHGHGAGPRHDLYRGGHVLQEYHHRRYVVENWRAHRLSPPPRGYHWVQAGGDYVLISNNNGLIVQIMLGG